MARQFQWLSAEGQLVTLTDRAAGYRVQADGTAGLNAPTYRFSTEQYANVDGVTVSALSADAREVTLGLLIQGDDEQMLQARVAALTRAMRPKAGPGQLVVADALGTTRRLTCYYSGGLEGSEARGTKLPGRWWKFAVKFMAEDPWWYGEPRSLSVGLGAPAAFFPIPPVTLSPSSVQGEFDVDLSDSDDPAYPVWTITGPGSDVVLTNETTGRVIEVNASLTSGQTMIIDTRPKLESIRRGDGANLMGFLVGAPDLWPLIDGPNQVTLALTGATGASRIDGTFQPRYSGT